MTLDPEDIAAIAAQVAELLGPMLKGLATALLYPPSSSLPVEAAGGCMTDHELVLLMAQTDPLKAIREREKMLRQARPRKRSKKV